MQTIHRNIFSAICLIGLLWFTGLQTAAAQTQVGDTAKRPMIFAGACTTCPWGEMGDVLKKALSMGDYGVEIIRCRTCAGGPRLARTVADKLVVTAKDIEPEDIQEFKVPADFKGTVDFGGTGIQFTKSAYEGANDYANDPAGARKDLRLIAFVQKPGYYTVAVRSDLDITDLKEIGEKQLAVKIVGHNMNQRTLVPEILEYYGLTEEEIVSYGGEFTTDYEEDAEVDVMIGIAAMLGSPEYRHWMHAHANHDFKYLELDPALREELAEKFYLTPVEMPEAYLRGVDRHIPTVANTGEGYISRADLPDDVAYAVAKALDEQQSLFMWTQVNMSYNTQNVWNANGIGIPLHPGAERYYREKGYMK